MVTLVTSFFNLGKLFSDKRIHRLEREDTVKSGRFLDTLDKRIDMYWFYSSSSSRAHHRHHRQHHKRSEYFPEEFKKVKPLSFDGEMKNPMM